MKIPVWVAIDDRFVPFAATLFASILYNTKSDVEFVAMHDKTLTKFHMLQLREMIAQYKNASVRFVLSDSGDIVDKNIVDTGRCSDMVFARLRIPDMAPSYGKILYLDCDIIATGDIAELYVIDLNGCGIGAVKDYMDPEYPKKILQMKNYDDYFNAGVLLMDCEWWRKNKASAELVSKINAKKLNYNDQDLLNLYFDGRYKILDKKFNFTFSNLDIESGIKNHYDLTDDFIVEKYRDCVLKHYIGGNKPWNSLCGIFSNFEDFWFFMKRTPFYEGALARFLACASGAELMQ